MKKIIKKITKKKVNKVLDRGLCSMCVGKGRVSDIESCSACEGTGVKK